MFISAPSFKKKTLLLGVILLLSPFIVSAHQPRIVTSGVTVVTDPEISKAFYGKLTGEPAVYTIHSDKPFDLYVNTLVPDIEGQKKDVSAAVIKNGDTDHPLAVLEGINFEWKKFFEPFGYDTYWQGPEYKATVEAGDYEVRVWSSNNDSKYSLAIGEKEMFDFKEGMNALHLVPELKRDFFNESPINFILAPFGYGLIVIMYVLAFIIGFLYRWIARKLVKNSSQAASKNIGRSDRIVRACIGVGLLLLAITTTWSPILLFLSGFAFFEAIFSWCAFYVAIGKNTCPI